MLQKAGLWNTCRWAGGLALVLFIPVHDVCAQGRHVLYQFCRSTGCADGSEPVATLIPGPGRTFYGTTAAGGANNQGTVFKLSLRSTETVLYSFQGGSDGAEPEAALVADKGGNLYGTTAYGGNEGCSNGCGTVFKIAPDGSETVLHAFDGSDGEYPQAGLIADKKGNLYGTTYLGGITSYCFNLGCGTIFKVSYDGTETVLYAFKGDPYSDGYFPSAGLVADENGNFYGTTTRGGGNGDACDGYGCGTVFTLAPDGTETILFAFSGGEDGDGPQGTLVRDAGGNLYGTTETNDGGDGYGTVFKIDPNGRETVLHGFSGHEDGRYPLAGLIADAQGDLYGTTIEGGGAGCSGTGCGTVFKLGPDGTQKLLWRFGSGKRGFQPWGGLWENQTGELFGTTIAVDDSDSGTIFKLTQ